jgi:spore germination cell wall hydrolase CwlJ-like protein
MSPVPDPQKLFWGQDPLILLAMCIWGEARSQGLDGKLGVACVVRNRVHLRWLRDNSYPSVILRSGQFDCFRNNDPNSSKLLRPLCFESRAVWEACYSAAKSVYQDNVQDNTQGSVFYFSPPVTEPPAAWGKVEFVTRYDDLHFYRLAS